MGMDTSGSRSLEAFLGSPASAKLKKRAARKLAGSYAKLGSTPGGSHVAQACYRTAVSLSTSITSESSCRAALHSILPGAARIDAAGQILCKPVLELCTVVPPRARKVSALSWSATVACDRAWMSCMGSSAAFCLP